MLAFERPIVLPAVLRNGSAIGRESNSALVKYILEQALILQEKLASFGRSSPDLKRSEFKAYRQIFSTLLTIGDSSGALAAADHARQIIETVLAVQPEDPDTQFDVVGSYEGLGEVCWRRGKREDALAAYCKALATAQRVVGRDTGTAAVARNYLNIGDVRIGRGTAGPTRPSRSIRWVLRCGKARSIGTKPTLSGSGSSARATRGLASRCWLKVNARRRSLPSKSESRSRQGLCDNYPWTIPSSSSPSVAHIKIGDVLLEQGKPDEALNEYQKALAICKSLPTATKGQLALATRGRHQLQYDCRPDGDYRQVR